MRVAMFVRLSFQPTLPARGATAGGRGADELLHISTHAPRTGSDPAGRFGGCLTAYFNPRSPHGERPGGQARRRNEHPISTHAPRTGSDQVHPAVHKGCCISTHAPRTGSDPCARGCPGEARTISTHAPRTGSDGRGLHQRGRDADFNPRSPHGERRSCAHEHRRVPNFNPRSPHGERRQRFAGLRHNAAISTHAPRTGSDGNPVIKHRQIPPFQPTLPARGATMFCQRRQNIGMNFNPRSPHGERHQHHGHQPEGHHFNPRSPHGERPDAQLKRFLRQPISTHAPRTGSDLICLKIVVDENEFQPTLPARGATLQRRVPAVGGDISTHAPRTGSDTPPQAAHSRASAFQPTLPARGATHWAVIS